MPCFSPIQGFRAHSVNPDTGKRSIVFNCKEGFRELSVELPCGNCIGCRLEKSRQWAMRIMHEAQLHEHNSFLTLTYSDQYLPKNNSLKKDDVQKFLKRLRRRLDKPIRYYQCGEYGEKFHRPHYHMCLFGHDFYDDREHFKTSTGDKLYVSELLSEVWGMGHCLIGDLTFESAAYVARYVTKKLTVTKWQNTMVRS